GVGAGLQPADPLAALAAEHFVQVVCLDGWHAAPSFRRTAVEGDPWTGASCGLNCRSPDHAGGSGGKPGKSSLSDRSVFCMGSGARRTGAGTVSSRAAP